MTYTPYLARCCEILGETQEYDSDKFLVAMVKIQRLLDCGAEVVPDNEDDPAHSVQYTPCHMALTSIQKEMEVLVRDQPPEVECNCTSSLHSPVDVASYLTDAALLWTHYHATMCRLFEPVIYIRSASVSGHDPSLSTARTAALWQCLNSARDFFSAYLAISPQSIPCMPFHGVHLSFCVVTTVKLLLLGDEHSLPGASSSAGAGAGAGDPDWNASLARAALGFEAVSARLGDFLDEADTLSGGPGRRARYVDHERTVLSMHRDKIRWIHNWYVARTRPGGPTRWPSTYPHFPGSDDRGRAAGAGGGDEGEGEHLGSGGGPAGSTGGSSHIPSVAHQGQAMDVDYGMPPSQTAMPGDLDDGFWQAMFDWGWNGGAELMEVQG